MAINYPVIFKTDTSAIDKAGGSLKKFGGIAAGVGAAAGAAIAGIAVTSIKEFAKFDSALNKSISIMGDVSDTLQDDMAQAAKDVAKTTSFSAEQAAESYFFLASAGLDAAASVEAMPQVAAFAQAGMFDMATATDLATDAQSALGLASDDAGENLENLTRVTDVFVAANTLANTSVEQLAAAMTSKAGNALKTVGKDIEEGSAALAVFADQGIKGERAGTLLTNTLFGLTDNAQKNAGAFKDLGIEVFEADGSMKNMADIANSVTTAFDGMSEEQKLAELSALGFTKQTREGVLALAGNGETLAEYEEALRNAGGTADEVAKNQLNTLDAQFGLLKDTVGVVAIEIGEQFNEPLRDMLKAINPIVDAAGPKFVDFFGNIADGVGVAAEKLTFFVENMPQIDKALETAFASGGVSGVIEEFMSLFIDGFSFEGAFEKISAFAMQLRMAIIDALPGIIEGLLEFIPQFVTFITETLIPQMLENAQLIFTELIAMVTEVLPMIAEGIATLIPELVQSLADLLPVIIETVLGFIPQILETGLTVFNSIVDALIEIIPQLIDTLVEMLPKIIETLMEMLPRIIEAGLELFMGIVNALVETIPVILEAIVEAMPQITEQLILMLPTLIEAALELFFGIVTGLVESIPKILTAIIEMIPEITAQMIEMLPDIVEAAIDLFFGIVEGLVEATPEILGAIIELIPKITGALIGELPKLLEAGFQILVGIKDGIMNNLSRIASDIASSIFNAINSGVRSFFGIESPSKEMMKIGEDISAGLAEGIKDAEGLAVGASLDMSSKVKIASENAIEPNRPPSLGDFDSANATSSAGSNISITVNTGVGSDPVAVGREVVNAIRRYESTNGKVFATA